MTEGQIALIISGISSLITLSIAIAAWRSAIAAKKATRAQLYIRLMEEYGSRQMSDALRGIKEFSERQSISSALRELKKILPDAQKLQNDATVLNAYDFSADKVGMKLKGQAQIDSYRRVVKYYFIKLLRLRENKFLSKKLMKELGKVAGIDIFYDIIQPIEFALDEDFDFSNFEKIKKICGRYDERR
ncbi:MAG: hypothetical protein MUP30_09275 [Deltaproteobacteria bacterium]|nr:hypothetical protein [Deltaproteobacteria bacterium]